MERGLTIFALLWQLAWTLSEIAPRALSDGQPLVIGAVVATVVGLTCVFLALWGPSAMRERISGMRLLDLSLVVACVLVLGLEPSGSGWPAASLMSAVACAVAALTLRTGPAIAVVAAASVVSGGELVVTSGSPFVDAAMFSLYGAALGCGAVVLVWGLRSTGGRLDAAHAEQVQAEAQALADLELARATLEHESRLHDRVLNTLAAIARGGLDDRADEVRTRCGQAASELRSLTSAGATDPRGSWEDVRDEVENLRADGVTVLWEGVDARAVGLPPRVVEAAGTAIAEALRNVVRHAAAEEVRVTVQADARHLRVAIADDGVGLPEQVKSKGLGIPVSIVGAMGNVGGSAEVLAGPPGGTLVTVTWEQPVVSASAFESDVLRVLPQIAPPFLATFLLYGLVVLGASLGDYTRPGLALLALGAALAFAVPLGLVPSVAARVGLTGAALPRSWRPLLGVLIAMAAPVVVYSGEMGALDGTALPAWGTWSSEVGLALLFTAVMLGPRWTILPALAAWVLAQGGDPWELLRPGSLMLVIAAVFAESMHRRARQYATSMSRVIASTAAEEALSLDAERRRARYAPVARFAVPLLEGLREGSLDYRDPGTRAMCALEERFARSVVRLDPAAGHLPASLLGLVVDARHRDIFVDADLTQPPPDSAAVSMAIPAEEILVMSPGSAVRVTTGWEEDRLVARLTSADGEGDLFREWELRHDA
ncbi:MAG: sensor histidine kinase [Candidatus Nanopelagicales bacterium]